MMGAQGGNPSALFDPRPAIAVGISFATRAFPDERGATEVDWLLDNDTDTILRPGDFDFAEEFLRL